MKKILLVLVLVPLVLLMLMMGVVSLAPQSLLALLNRAVDGVEVQAQELGFSWFPLQVQSQALNVDVAGMEISASALQAEVNWLDWYTGEPFWSLQAQRLVVLPGAQSSPGSKAADEAGPDDAGGSIPLHPILNFTEVAVEEFRYGDDLAYGSLQLSRVGQSLSIATEVITPDAAGVLTLQTELLEVDADLLMAVEQGLLEFTVGQQPPRQLQLGGGQLGWQSAQQAFEVALEIEQSDLQLAGRLLAGGGVEAEVGLASAELPDWIPVAPFAAAQILPLTLDTQLRVSSDSVAVTGLRFVSPTNQLSADVMVTMAEPLRVNGQLEAEQLFVPLTPATEETEIEAEAVAQISSEDTGDEPADTPLFSAAPLDWTWLQQLEIDFTAHADRLLVQAAEFSDLQLRVLLQEGVLTIKPLSGTYGQGGFGGELRVAASEGGAAEVSVTYTMQGIALEDFGLMPSDELQGGALNASLRMDTQGSSAAELASALNGEMALDIGSMRLANNLLDLAGSDLLLEALNRLNPFRQQDPQTLVQCGVLHFAVKDGVVQSQDKLVVETGKMRIEGEATVDLASEDLDMTFTPRAKGGFGVGMGNLVKFVKLGGTLRSPAMEMDAAGLLHSGAAVGAALSTGGVSLLAEGLARRVLGDSGCAQQAVEQVLEEDAETETGEGVEIPTPQVQPAEAIDTENT